MNQLEALGTVPTWWRPYHVRSPAATTGWWPPWTSVSLTTTGSVDPEPRSHECSVSTVMVSRSHLLAWNPC